MSHVPVLLKEVIEYLVPKPGQKFIDATFGGGGHGVAISKAIGKKGSLLAIDANLDAVKDSRFKIRDLRFKIVHGNFRDIGAIARKNGFEKVDGILFDLGLSSDMLDDPQRGFSFQKDGPLDMRYDRGKDWKAYDFVNLADENQLAEIFKKYGEEKFSKKIARAIVNIRKEEKIETTAELFNLIKQALPGKLRHKSGGPARRIFQAIRIEVNDELGALKAALPQTLQLLDSGSRLAVISFHSLEDRIVKHFFRDAEKGCTCPVDFPRCVCGKKPLVKILTKKPVVPSEEEIAINSRARPAKLRVAEKI